MKQKKNQETTHYIKVYNLVPDVWQLFGLSHCGGDVGMEDTDSVDRCRL